MRLNHEQALPDTSPATSLAAPLRPSKASKWRTASALLSIGLAAISIIAIVNHIGVHITGDVLAWQQWMRAHALHFFIWRVFVYGIASAGWTWIRRRRLQRFPTKEMGQQMSRTEIFLVAFIVIFEIQKWLLRA